MAALEAYDPTDSFSYYDNYYRQQVGHGVQVYTGRRYMPQSGAGIGSLFSSLLRAAAPIAKGIGKRALATGAKIAGDVVQGRNFKESAREHFKQSGADLLGDLQYAAMPDSNKKRAAPRGKKRKRNQRGKGLPRSKKRSIF